MATPESKSEVIYQSGTNEALGAGWDVMQVVYRNNDDGQMRTRNSFVIARDLGGKIIRKTDILLDRWEVVNDEETLRSFEHCFDERDRLRIEKPESVQYVGAAENPCKCGHAFATHTKHVHGANEMRVDEALLPEKRYDIFSDKPGGESGCTECPCRQWVPASY